ncbi:MULTISPECIES: hypothetical protein [unclassified Rhodococcus (in: high G+C Gram-positive bacteria)]|uniref:hypothetical protein n=1 Tax=unclassified Rhodococcus (in: high G+C Gram-positive bacteria) TaxID=192944 RepID=UPI00163A01C1|nr:MULTISPECIES: hypothetical protein [unclassified Rhodococcus (in: high G+C Gram-positive bacteria)]MBC2644188.1 hypothetical protein [Rhodococcus sp. 3A]MBC2891073.1 hypothetical protein [Rhodococcus sp. 4CII]
MLNALVAPFQQPTDPGNPPAAAGFVVGVHQTEGHPEGAPHCALPIAAALVDLEGTAPGSVALIVHSRQVCSPGEFLQHVDRERIALVSRCQRLVRPRPSLLREQLQAETDVIAVGHQGSFNR